MLSKKERKKLKLEKLRQQSEQARLEFEQKKKKEVREQETVKSKKFKIYTTLAVVSLVIILSVGTFAIINAKKPGYYDNFAKCLTEKGAVMYELLFVNIHMHKKVCLASHQNI